MAYSGDEMDNILSGWAVTKDAEETNWAACRCGLTVKSSSLQNLCDAVKYTLNEDNPHAHIANLLGLIKVLEKLDLSSLLQRHDLDKLHRIVNLAKAYQRRAAEGGSK